MKVQQYNLYGLANCFIRARLIGVCGDSFSAKKGGSGKLSHLEKEDCRSRNDVLTEIPQQNLEELKPFNIFSTHVRSSSESTSFRKTKSRTKRMGCTL